MSRQIRRWVVTAVLLLTLTALAGYGLVRLIQDVTAPDSPVYETTTGATELYLAGDGETSLLVHCGNSMRPAAEQLAREFQQQHGMGIHFNFGGSSQLLPAIELARQGDIYLCHDPYAERLLERDLLEEYAVVGYLEPIIVTAKDNPKRVTSLADLSREGLRVGLTDPRYSTAGELVQAALAGQGLTEATAANVRMESRDHNTLALAIMAGQLDAAVGWNFLAYLYEAHLERIVIDTTFPETRVTACLLTHAQNPAAARLFMDFLTSDRGREVFAKYGYTKID